MVWSTKGRHKILKKRVRISLSDFLSEYSLSKGIYMKANYVNSDHVHILIDLPSNMTIESIAKTLKGGSSYWLNRNRLTKNKFSWARGYGAFSVSQSNLDKVIRYIADQETHHKKRSFTEEYEAFLKLYQSKKNRYIGFIIFHRIPNP